MSDTPLGDWIRQKYQKAHPQDAPSGNRAWPSTRALAKASGDRFTHTVAGHLLNGLAKDYDEETVEGLVVALRVPVGEVRRALAIAAGNLGEFKLPKRANRLTQREREVVLSVVDSILAAHQKGSKQTEGETVRTKDSHGLAARRRTPGTRP